MVPQLDRYGSAHRILFTYIRAMKYIDHPLLVAKTGVLVQELFGEVLTADDAATALDTLVRVINHEINPHGFSIDKTIDETSGKLIYLACNRQVDSTSLSFTAYSAAEIDVIKAIIAEVVTHGYRRRQVDVESVVASTKPGGREANYFLSRLINDGWFLATTGGEVVLSTRLVYELREYLAAQFGDLILVCQQCDQLVTIGVKYGDMSFHRKCFEVYCAANRVSHEPQEDIGVEPSQIVTV